MPFAEQLLVQHSTVIDSQSREKCIESASVVQFGVLLHPLCMRDAQPSTHMHLRMHRLGDTH